MVEKSTRSGHQYVDPYTKTEVGFANYKHLYTDKNKIKKKIKIKIKTKDKTKTKNEDKINISLPNTEKNLSIFFLATFSKLLSLRVSVGTAHNETVGVVVMLQQLPVIRLSEVLE